MCSWKEAHLSLNIKKTAYHKVFSVYRFIFRLLGSNFFVIIHDITLMDPDFFRFFSDRISSSKAGSHVRKILPDIED
jgi:hypothetical protein